MNLMSASVAVADPITGTDRLAVVLIPADSPGIDRAPFWQTNVLAAAESDQVTLTEVFVPEALIFYPHDGEAMDPIQARGFVWFELLISASYLGAATNLAERAIARGRGTDQDRAGLAIELESVAAALEQVASSAATADDNEALLARALYARFATEQAIERVAMSAAAALGGMFYISSPEIAYLLGAVRALAFHPPSRAAAAAPIARYVAGTSPTTGPGRRVTRSCVPTPSSSGPTSTAVAWASKAVRVFTATLIPPTRRLASWNLTVAATTRMARAISSHAATRPPGAGRARTSRPPRRAARRCPGGGVLPFEGPEMTPAPRL
jgi:hypothetical protein